MSNPIWTLNDGGHWKSVIQFPAYAVPGTLGRTFMNELSLYSGNVTTAPDGTDLTSVYGPGGEARLFADMTVGKQFSPHIQGSLLIGNQIKDHLYLVCGFS